MPRILLALAGLIFTVYCVVDAVKADENGVRGLPKLLWVFITLLFPVVGGIAWLIAGRPEPLIGGRGQGRAPRPRGPQGPDDDPDFLRGL